MDTEATKKHVIAIVGPTASGKSDLAIRIAKKLHGEIISADSRQVYRGMDIGTGKVTKKEQKIVKHYLLDVADPKKQFTVSDFKKLGERAIDKILAEGKIPVIAGGTGFYIDILLGRMRVAETPPNKKLRAELEKQSAEQLFKRLSRLDPLRAKTIDQHNKRRLIRALEIFLATKKTSVIDSPTGTHNPQDNVLWLGINPGKEKLAKNIKVRLEKRLKQGMLKEAVKLHENGLSWKKMDDFGLEYRWLSRYLKGSITKEEMTENLYKDIVKYSKRQMTWFKRNKDIHWVKNNKTAEALARRFLNSK